MSTPPLRALHVHSGNLYGGVETLLATIARHQGDALGARHVFALCFPGRCADELAAAGAQPEMLGPVRIRAPWTILRARRRLAALLGADRPDVVVTHSAWTHALFAPVARAAGLQLVHWRHGASDGRHWLERWARHSPPDLLICNSRFAAGSAGFAFPGVRAEVLYYPVERSSLPATGRRDIRAALGTPEDAAVVVQVSRMEAWKGHPVLLNALAILRERVDWSCWIVGGAQRPGEAAYLGELRRRATRLGVADRVRFTGERSDVPALLAAADVFCQPNSGPEPFGIVFIEALAHQLPVVATAIGAAPEIVDARCGLLVAPGDPEALAAALRELLDDPARRAALGAAGPARAEELCDPARQLRRLGDLLRSVVEGEVPAPEERPR